MESKVNKMSKTHRYTVRFTEQEFLAVKNASKKFGYSKQFICREGAIYFINKMRVVRDNTK